MPTEVHLLRGAEKGGHHVRIWRGLGGGRPGYELGCRRIEHHQQLTCLQGSRQFEPGDPCALHLFAAGFSRSLLCLELPLITDFKGR